MKKAYIITTINPPNQNINDILFLAQKEKSIVIIVGDKKTSHDAYDNFDGLYLSPNEQEKRWPKLSNLMPWNHYSRKNFGYLAAIEMSVDIIVETDDDNMPLNGFGKPPEGKTALICSNGWFDPYSYFTDRSLPVVKGYNRNIWARGFPLGDINSRSYTLAKEMTDIGKIAVWQGMVEGDSDIDAICRMTSDCPVIYNQNPPIAINRGIWCPFNSQNTIWNKCSFEHLYLPSNVSFRFTDILRSYIAQQQFWKNGLYLGYTGPTTYSQRNEHNLLNDFIDEIEMYKNATKISEVLMESQNIHNSYRILENINIAKDERFILDAWMDAFWRAKK